MHRIWLLIAACIALPALGVGAEDPPLPASKPEVRKEIVGVINAQLAAFRQHDLQRAYVLAASALRAQKPLPVFMAIVRANYPEIWDNTRAECGIVRDDGQRGTVLVHVFAKNGDVSYDYSLVKEPAGWRISGVLRHEAIEEDKV